ncbi:MAG TPA: nitroreductase family deazaflavin-dependent oxidoreductase [Candidatus Binatia bacterium]|nr:nitroreductase family deazaflavin-dependent oxidoreductase [Candidatus Binatia bacterium]
MATSAPRPFTPAQERLGSAVIRLMSIANVWLYRLTGGRLGGRFLRGAPVLLLTTVGRRSGQPRTVPLLYLRRGDTLLVVASKGGMSRHPLWYRNLAANPRVEVEIGRERRAMTARRLDDAEKARVWPDLVAMYPDYAAYQARTPRNIPVVALTLP